MINIFTPQGKLKEWVAINLKEAQSLSCCISIQPCSSLLTFLHLAVL